MEQKWIDRFWKRVDKTSSPNGCWAWTGGTHSQGYGMYSHYPNKVKKTMTAHRFSAILHNIDMSHGPVIRHLCNNPICCNPDHLVSGTQKDNMKDMLEAGRHRTKRNNFTKEFIIDLQNQYKNGMTQLELSKKYNIVSSYISVLINRDVGEFYE